MSQQIVIIHGGDTYKSYEDYIDALKKRVIDISTQKVKGWKENLILSLGENYTVIMPSMPNKMNATYLEWKIWFEKYIPYIQDGAIFIGNSLGGIFLAKFFSEEEYTKKVKGLFLVAAPYQSTEHDYLGDFTFKNGVTQLSEKISRIYLYHSKDDSIVPFEQMSYFTKDLPQAVTRVYEDQGHFIVTETLPELEEDIRHVSTIN